MIKDVGMVVAILLVVIPVVAFARRIGIASPIALVVSGLALSFVPGVPKVELDPSLVLLIFLPPLLYWQAINAPTEIMRANAGQIGTLAFGLVAVTIGVVA